MKRLAFVSIAAVAWFAAACGGGGSSAPPPTPTGNFSNASLKGSYGFSMNGETVNGPGISRVGSFAADGNGNITAALEDVSSGGAVSQAVQFSGGTYSIQSNGKGTMTLNSVATGNGLQFSIVLTSANHGLMIETDLVNATSSGTFDLQSSAAFTQTAIANTYTFDVSGVDGSTGAPISVIGEFTTNGAGSITGGLFDTNDGGSLVTAQAIPTGGTYSFDATNGATFGRGTMTFLGFTFSFYIVDGTHINLLEIDATQAFTSGVALQQNGTIPTSASGWAPGGFVFVIGGAGVLGSSPGGPVIRGARFTTDGAGNLSKINLDDNNNGSLNSITSSSSVTAATYSIDTSGTGRGTLAFTSSGSPSLGAFSYVFYLVSPTQAVIQDTSNGIVGDGTMLAQSGSISASGLAGNYVLNWSGQNLGSAQNAAFEVDADAQYALSSSGSISGAVDLVELGSSTKGIPAAINIALSGTLTLSGDGTGSNAYTVTVQASPSNTFHYQAYIASSNVIFLVGHDTDRVIAGTVSIQP